MLWLCTLPLFATARLCAPRSTCARVRNHEVLHWGIPCQRAVRRQTLHFLHLQLPAARLRAPPPLRPSAVSPSCLRLAFAATKPIGFPWQIWECWVCDTTRFFAGEEGRNLRAAEFLSEISFEALWDASVQQGRQVLQEEPRALEDNCSQSAGGALAPVIFCCLLRFRVLSSRGQKWGRTGTSTREASCCAVRLASHDWFALVRAHRFDTWGTLYDTRREYSACSDHTYWLDVPSRKHLDCKQGRLGGALIYARALLIQINSD